MARNASVEALSGDELRKQKETLSLKAGELKTKIRELEAAIADPDLDPTMDFARAVAKIADTDQELRTAKALFVVVDAQLAAVNNMIAEAHRRERAAQAEALRPAEDAAKKRIVASFLEFVAALEDGRAAERQLKRVMAPTSLAELMPHDLRRELRRQADRLKHFASDQAANVPGSVLW